MFKYLLLCAYALIAVCIYDTAKAEYRSDDSTITLLLNNGYKIKHIETSGLSGFGGAGVIEIFYLFRDSDVDFYRCVYFGKISKDKNTKSLIIADESEYCEKHFF